MLDMPFFCSFAIFQIVLESFPISSSGHNILLERIWNKFFYFFSMNLSSGMHIAQFASWESIMHFLHGPTLIVFFVVFYSSLQSLVAQAAGDKLFLFSIFLHVIVADCITGLFYLLFKNVGTSWFPLPIGFFCTAVLLFSLHWCQQKKITRTPWVITCILGTVQGIALLPGISRLAATFVTARYLGFASARALEVSVLLETPLIIGAFSRSVFLLYRSNVITEILQPGHVLCITLATIIAIQGLFIVKRLVAKNRLWIFSVYMILPIIVSLLV